MLKTETEVLSRPIILRDWEVRAIRAGIKTTIRLPVEWKPAYTGLPASWPHDFNSSRTFADHGFPDKDGVHRYGYMHVACRHPEDKQWSDEEFDRLERVYYPLAAGDSFWVKETWRPWWSHVCGRYLAGVHFAADDYKVGLVDVAESDDPEFARIRDLVFRDVCNRRVDRWKSPAQLPRWASRLNLEITSVSASRLQSITEEQAVAEGSREAIRESGRAYDNDTREWCRWTSLLDTSGSKAIVVTAKAAFAMQWERRHGKQRPGRPGHSWAANPFVWTIEFRPI